MANKLPLFASAPRAVIIIDGTTVAYAVGLSLNASVNIQEVRILGEFAVQSLEPTAYLPVSGSFQIVRILDDATISDQKTSAAALNSKLAGDPTDTTTVDKVAAHNSTQGANGGNDFGQEELFRQLDPRTTLFSKSFDIEIKLKVPTTTQLSDLSTAQTDGLTNVGFLEVKDCRLSSASMNVAPNQLLTQSLEFQGLLLVQKDRGEDGVEESIDATVPDGNAVANTPSGN